MNKNQQFFAKMGGSSLALLLSLSLGQHASALTLVENLTQSSGGPTVVDFTTWQAASFTTGSGSYNLDSVTLLFKETAPGSNLFLRLYGNNNGTPGGAPITTFTNPASITNNLANNTFTLGASQLLTPNTTYWLAAEVSGNVTNSYGWGYTSSFNETGLPGWTIGDNYASNSQGLGWATFAGTPFQFSVNGTQNPPPPVNIPEPSSVVALLGLGGLGLASSLKKRK